MAVREAFRGDVDYAMLVKIYGNTENGESAHRRYRPGTVNGTDMTVLYSSYVAHSVTAGSVSSGSITLIALIRSS